MAKGKARVVERSGRITGYTTGIGYFNHSVAETNDDLEALIGAAAHLDQPGIVVPLGNPELFRWCLAHGLRVFFVMNMMTIGMYQDPQGRVSRLGRLLTRRPRYGRLGADRWAAAVRPWRPPPRVPSPSPP